MDPTIVPQLLAEIKALHKQVAELDSKLHSAIQAIPTKIVEVLGEHNHELTLPVLKTTTGSGKRGESSSSIRDENVISLITAQSSEQGRVNNAESSSNRILPDQFKLPNTNVKTFWDLWYQGNETEGVPALHSIKRKYLELDPQDKKTFSKGKSLISELEHFAKSEGFISNPAELYKMSATDRENLFFRIYEAFTQFVYEKKCHRPMDKSVGTLLNRLREVKKLQGIVHEADPGTSDSDEDGNDAVRESKKTTIDQANTETVPMPMKKKMKTAMSSTIPEK